MFLGNDYLVATKGALTALMYSVYVWALEPLAARSTMFTVHVYAGGILMAAFNVHFL